MRKPTTRDTPSFVHRDPGPSSHHKPIGMRASLATFRLQQYLQEPVDLCNAVLAWGDQADDPFRTGSGLRLSCVKCVGDRERIVQLVKLGSDLRRLDGASVD